MFVGEIFNQQLYTGTRTMNKNRFPNRTTIEKLLVVLQRQVPGQLRRARRALRTRDRNALEFELLKLSARLPPLASSHTLTSVLPESREPGEADWKVARETLGQMERALQQLTEELEGMLQEPG